MKKIIFLLVIIFGLISFGETMEITIPNENLENKNGVLVYNGVPFSGRIKMDSTDEDLGYSGSLNLENGHFEGLSEIKNDKEGMHVRFTILNGKFDGEVISKIPEIGEVNVIFNEGKLVSQKFSFIDGTEANLIYTPEGVVNGTMNIGGEKFTFKNSEAQFGSGKIKAKVDYEKQLLIMTVLEGKKTVQKIEQPLLTVKMFEEMLFPVITSEE